MSRRFSVRMFGPYACFTRPELKVERVSYEVLTPSAARGVLEAVFWRPSLRWVIEAIEVHRPIVFFDVRRNEVAARAHRPSAAVIAGRAAYDDYFADEDRQPRHTIGLRDVDYVVHARLHAPDAIDPARLRACAKMAERRLERGQHFHQPYFGCREFACFVEPAPAGRTPIELDRALGAVLLDVDHGPPARPRFFDAKLIGGVMAVPA